jgi:hypothetical protein
MSHVASNSPTGTRSERAYWVRSTIALPLDDGKPSPPKRPAGKRFVEPYRLTDEQRARLVAPLEEKKIGDDEGRTLFAAAMEYDLAGCRALAETAPTSIPAPPPAPAERDPALSALAAAAQALAEGLAALEPTAAGRLLAGLKEADRFKRDYGADYLDAISGELARIAAAAEAPVAAPKPPKPAPVPEEAKRFVLRAADAFRDCFEQKPTAQPESPFIVALEAIVAATAIPIPTDPRTLAQILEGKL